MLREIRDEDGIFTEGTTRRRLLVSREPSVQWAPSSWILPRSRMTAEDFPVIYRSSSIEI